MLRLIIGEDWVSNRNRILQFLAEDVTHQRQGRILIVPELISHDMERRLCIAAGDTTSRFAEVLSFSRLTSRVASYADVTCEPCLDAGGRVVAMASVARQLRGSLKAYAALETKPEFLCNLLDAVDEFKRCCILPQDLKAAADQTEGGFAQKLEELALLYEGYDSLAARGKRDPRDQMTWLLEQLEVSDFGENHTFYIDGFPDFTRQHMAILCHLISVSPNVVVSLNCDKIGSDRLAFQKAGETAKVLLNFAYRHGIPVEIEEITSENAELSAVRTHLLQGAIQAPTENCVKTYRAETVYEEVIGAAEQIMALVRRGDRFRDISVVCADMEGYGAAVEMVFDRFQIPHYIAGTENVLARPVIRTALTALEAVGNDFQQEDVLCYLRSALSPITLEECDKVENYVLLWGLDGKKWLTDWTGHPEGLGKEWREADTEALRFLNTIRHKVIVPLVHLRDGFRQAIKVQQQVTALYRFLEEIEISKRLDLLASDLESKGEYRDSQILSQLWEILLLALEQLYDALGETAWDGDTFTGLLKLLLSQYNVGTIPPVLDAVTVGPVSAMRCQEEKHLLVLGMLEGNMPGYTGASGVFNDRERTALREMGIPLTGGAMEGLSAEFSEIYGVFCGARESVTGYCPAGQTSFVYNRLRALSGSEEQIDPTKGFAVANRRDAAAYLAKFSAEKDADALGLNVQYEEMRKGMTYEFGTVCRENIRNLYGENLQLSASQVDKQANCRLLYFLQYGLRAKERKPATIDPAEFGTYVHDVLENTAREVMDRGGFAKISEEEILELARENSRKYIAVHFSQLDSQRVAYLFTRHQQELEMVVRELWDELRQSQFAPLAFELYFGQGGQMPPITVCGQNMDGTLRGFVDRVDAWQENGKNYFRVVDYKTGRKDFDYCDVFNGIGLQMLLYLFALEQGGEALLGKNPVPTGVQYFPARAPYVASEGILSDEVAKSARIKEWKRKGLLLGDTKVLSAMEPEDAPHRLDYSVKKDGSLSGNIASVRQFNQLKTYIFSLLTKMVDEIASGNVSPNPYSRGSYHNACEYCPYAQVCHPENVAERRIYQAMNGERFWEEIERQVNGNGR